ncbi:MAG TPA: hypothetical protein VMW34_05110 [Anaerolineales bacterium]|nr:hypothetical protein [Anaerolineales bacterium]
MNLSIARNQKFNAAFSRFSFRRGFAFGLIIISALLAFEIFNYSTTEFALSDLLGDLDFAGVSWATILALAFCGIDFAGIARLFTPEEGAGELHEVWYLFGAWLLAATMNAMLTWWGVSLALLNHESLGNAVVDRETLLKVVPLFVAILVWLIRVLIIGTFSVAGDRLFSQTEQYRPTNGSARSHQTMTGAAPVQARKPATRSAYKPTPQPEQSYARPEPTYHPLSMSATGRNKGNHGSS